MATRIKEKYLAEAIPALEEKFGYTNAMQVPKLAKIVINMGLGDCKDNAKAMEMAVNELTAIAGQKLVGVGAFAKKVHQALELLLVLGADVSCLAP